MFYTSNLTFKESRLTLGTTLKLHPLSLISIYTKYSDKYIMLLLVYHVSLKVHVQLIFRTPAPYLH